MLDDITVKDLKKKKQLTDKELDGLIQYFKERKEKMNYKDTLLMPKTDFEMRGNLPKKEPKYVERWQENDMYNKVIQQNEGKDSFVFHDGPPYAHGAYVKQSHQRRYLPL